MLCLSSAAVVASAALFAALPSPTPALPVDEPPPAAAAKPQVEAPQGAARLKQEAEALRPIVRTDLGRHFLDATAALPTIAPRTVYVDPETRDLLPEAEVNKRDEAARAKLKTTRLSENLYYYTRYGSPLAYVRPLEVLAERGGVKNVEGKRILDFGYGTIGHLRLLASLGADAVGVDVDPFLSALYNQPEDTGAVAPTAGAKRSGSVTLVQGQWPGHAPTATAVGGKFDIILSKNTLKNGYLHPERPVDKALLVDLGVSEEAFLKSLYDALNPGGHVLIYNLSPAPAKPDEPYRPWADGRSPFRREQWEKAGFKVIAFDEKEDEAAHRMAHALGWDNGPGSMDLKKDLFSHYTLVQKPSTK